MKDIFISHAWGKDELNREMIERHRNFCHWGRLLRETIYLYGTNINDKYNKTKTFYHGLKPAFIFTETIAKFCAPTSTTASLTIAHGFADGRGIMLKLTKIWEKMVLFFLITMIL